MKRILIGLLAFFALNFIFEMAPMVFAPVRQDAQVVWAIGPDAIAPNARVTGYYKGKKVNYMVLYIVIGVGLFFGRLARIIYVRYEYNHRNRIDPYSFL